MAPQKKTERKKPSEADRRHIIGMSGGCCNICQQSLFIDGEFGEHARLGDDAHIISASSVGPRGDETISPSSRAKARNLILLCKTCHSKVDQQPLEFPAHRLVEIRDKHYQWVQQSLGSRIVSKPRFHYLSYINLPRVDMYAVVNSIGLPPVDLLDARSVRDLGIGAGRLMYAYVGVLNHEDLYANVLSKTTRFEELAVGTYWYSEPASFRTKKVDDAANTVEAWTRQESVIYRKFDGWKLICLIDPRWITTSTAYALLSGGRLESMGLVHINHVDPDQGEVIASPLFLGAPDRGFL